MDVDANVDVDASVGVDVGVRVDAGVDVYEDVDVGACEDVDTGVGARVVGNRQGVCIDFCWFCAFFLCTVVF